MHDLLTSSMLYIGREVVSNLSVPPFDLLGGPELTFLLTRFHTYARLQSSLDTNSCKHKLGRQDRIILKTALAVRSNTPPAGPDGRGKISGPVTVSEEAVIGLPSSVVKERPRSPSQPFQGCLRSKPNVVVVTTVEMSVPSPKDLIREIESFCQSQVIRLSHRQSIEDLVTIDRAASAFTACPAPGKRKPSMSEQENQMLASLPRRRRTRRF